MSTSGRRDAISRDEATQIIKAGFGAAMEQIAAHCTTQFSGTTMQHHKDPDFRRTARYSSLSWIVLLGSQPITSIKAS
jgi:hypothetical protein